VEFPLQHHLRRGVGTFRERGPRDKSEPAVEVLRVPCPEEDPPRPAHPGVIQQQAQQRLPQPSPLPPGRHAHVVDPGVLGPVRESPGGGDQGASAVPGPHPGRGSRVRPRQLLPREQVVPVGTLQHRGGLSGGVVVQPGVQGDSVRSPEKFRRRSLRVGRPDPLHGPRVPRLAPAPEGGEQRLDLLGAAVLRQLGLAVHAVEGQTGDEQPADRGAVVGVLRGDRRVAPLRLELLHQRLERLRLARGLLDGREGAVGLGAPVVGGGGAGALRVEEGAGDHRHDLLGAHHHGPAHQGGLLALRRAVEAQPPVDLDPVDRPEHRGSVLQAPGQVDRRLLRQEYRRFPGGPGKFAPSHGGQGDRTWSSGKVQFEEFPWTR
jgi:hypothetical protein